MPDADADAATASACVLCASRRARQPVLAGVVDKRYRVEGRWDFRRCPDCGLVALHPVPADPAAGYPQGYSPHQLWAPGVDGAGRSRLRRWLRRRSLAGLGYRLGSVGSPSGGGAGAVEAVEPGPVDRLVAAVPAVRVGAQWGCLLVPPARPGGRILDVGCGAGRFLLVMRALGWDVTGVEPDGTSRAVAAGQGLRVAASVAEGGFEPGSFDVVTLNHVIEHVDDPVGMLRSLRPLLAPGGRLGVATPNWAALGRRLFGRSWYALEAPRHLVLFDRRTLRATVEAGGFRVASAATRSSREGPVSWRVSWSLRRGRPAPPPLVAAGAAAFGLSALVGAGEEIELWATPQPAATRA